MGGAGVCGEWGVWECVEVVWCVCGGVGWGRVGCGVLGCVISVAQGRRTDKPKKTQDTAQDMRS